ncbi:hypothetical protein [Streptomyces sp. NBC_00147]|uniref:hypothetical protein n=1 Tax=Streptomyces sp. NBC_00147 TaxID=2975667 RepID=UPI002F912D58
MARALAAPPRVLVLDEAVTALDVSIRRSSLNFSPSSGATWASGSCSSSTTRTSSGASPTRLLLDSAPCRGCPAGARPEG